jgi:hypothetical protein
MARSRKHRTAAPIFDAIEVEGALISPAMLARIAQHQTEGQTDAAYGVPKGLTLRDEIARYFRMGQAMFKELTASEIPSAAATLNFVEKLLRDVFGFADITRIGTRILRERQFTISLEAVGGRTPITVVPATEELDRPSAHMLTDGHRRSAAAALQNWLNAFDGALWGLCSNGLQLRLVRDNASLTRPAYIEADLRRIFEGDAFADFTALWLLIHGSRFGTAGALPSDCALERWRDAGQKEGVAARDKLRDGVEAALLSLGTGFLSHSDNGPLQQRLQSGDLPLPEFFGELLRLVYRLIFLFAAEDRDLLHSPGAELASRKLYAEGYSVASLRDRAVRRAAWDRHHDRWEGLLITFVSLARGENRLGLPALAGLFANDAIPHLQDARLSNRSLMEAIFRLAWLRDESGVQPVNWRDMETEELGSVYESLLELTPQLSDDGRALVFAEGGEAKGHARKTTGSYYTPDSLVQALLDSALDPVLDRVEAEADDTEKALLGVTVLDPACGSGHFLLAAARRIATRLARVRTNSLATPADYRHAMRDVTRTCIHGVDRNPMAVELCRVALWIETVEPGKPLTFLDSHIRCGDSLVGVLNLSILQDGIPDAAYQSIPGDNREAASYFRRLNKAEGNSRPSLDIAGPPRDFFEVLQAANAMPEEEVAEIDAKKKRFEAIRAGQFYQRMRHACDLWTAAFFATKDQVAPAARQLVPTTDSVWQGLRGVDLNGQLQAEVDRLTKRYRFFHWPLEFEAMSGRGFDVVLGNPPWDKLQPEEKNFFAAICPDISSASSAKLRKDLIESLPQTNPVAHALWSAHKRDIDATCHFLSSAGQLTLSTSGNLNTYRIFAELASKLLSKRGRCGLVLQSGFATDESGKELFNELVSQSRLVRFLDFENRLKFFPDVDSRFRFSLVTIDGSPQKSVSGAEFGWLLHALDEIQEPDRLIKLSSEDLLLFNPETRTCPVFVSQRDLELSRRLYRRGMHISAIEGNHSGKIAFLGELFNLTRDSRFFLQRSNRQETAQLPLYEAKYIHQYDHRFASTINDTVVELRSEAKLDPKNLAVTGRTVKKAEVQKRLRDRNIRTKWLCGFRDIASATNERTAIMAVLPESAVGNSINLVLGLSAKDVVCWFVSRICGWSLAPVICQECDTRRFL